MENNRQVNVSNEQVMKACGSAAKLLTDDERVSVPPSLAMSGDLSIAVGVLTSLSTGQAVITNPPLPEVTDSGNDEESSEE